MDGRGRLAEPLTDGASRPVAGAAPGRRRLRINWPRLPRSHRVRIRLPRLLRRFSPQLFWRLPRGVGVAAATVFLFGSVTFGAVRGGHLPAVLDELIDMRHALANALGFRITSIALAGHRHVTREEILTTAGVTGRTSLMFLDATAARARLMSNSWIADATVLKLYPGRLHIAVTERDAFALWQKSGKVAVIADDGTVVEPYVSKRFAKLPLVVGTGAESRAKDFLALLDRYPAVREQVQAIVLIAERRWNLRLNSGVDVRLPETGIETALETLIALDRDKKLLSRDIVAVDLRLPDRVTVRLSEEAAAARAEALKPVKAKRKGGDA
jgi:cell division protein FtsQ